MNSVTVRLAALRGMTVNSRFHISQLGQAGENGRENLANVVVAGFAGEEVLCDCRFVARTTGHVQRVFARRVGEWVGLAFAEPVASGARLGFLRVVPFL